MAFVPDTLSYPHRRLDASWALWLTPILWTGVEYFRSELYYFPYERRMLHGRMAPIRSAEYGIPTFGVWSCGESQLTDRFGRVIATAGYPGQGEMIAGPFDLAEAGHLPPDRWLAVAATFITSVFIILVAVGHMRGNWKRKRLSTKDTTE